jgi:hypothetical protein
MSKIIGIDLGTIRRGGLRARHGRHAAEPPPNPRLGKAGELKRTPALERRGS